MNILVIMTGGTISCVKDGDWITPDETRTYVFEGVPVSLADNLPESVTVTEVGGTSHTVHLHEYVTDGSSGTAIFENDRNTVTIHRVSPHMRTIEVTRTVATLKENGAVIKAAPGW